MAGRTKGKKNRKFLRIFLAIDALLLVAVIAVVAYQQLLRPMALIGDKDVVVNVGEEYKDEGTTSRLAKASGEVDTDTPGDYTITYTRGSSSITRVVHVVDPSILVLGLKGSQHTIVKEGDPYIESGAFGVNKKTGAVREDDISIKGSVDTSKPGNYKVKYTVRSGYITKKITRDVEVVAASEFKANKSGVPVLMYHYIYTEKDKPDTLNTNYTSAKDFEAQLKYLTDKNYYYPSFAELRAYVDGKISLPEKSVLLTFDDAQHGFFDYGTPLLEKYQVPATSFVIGVQNGSKKVKLRANPYIQFQSHSFDMHKPGGNIGHGGVISAMSKSEIEADLSKSFKQVGNSDAFAYPFGDITDTAKAAVAASGVQCAFSTADGKAEKGDDYRSICRIRVSGGNTLSVFISRL